MTQNEARTKIAKLEQAIEHLNIAQSYLETAGYREDADELRPHACRAALIKNAIKKDAGIYD